ncbi:MAG: glucosamine 6-phosphate synthetase [Bacteroidetes bacterium]|nr:glucosamine 6-phosphate synthetase [Bacteroidota bacterium]
MCGIFGIIIKEKTNYPPAFIEKRLKDIALASIVRGQDSSGIIFKNTITEELKLIKGDVPVTTLFKSKEYKNSINEAIELYKNGQPFQAIGHARLVTNGSQLKEINNQPVIKDGIIGIHNGIIVNHEELWKANPDLIKEYDIDTEVLLSLIVKQTKKENLLSAITNSLDQIEGTASCAILFDYRNELALFTNNGSLYYVLEDDFLIFASEEYFLKQIFKKESKQVIIKHLKPLEIFVLNTITFKNNLTAYEENANSHKTYKIISTCLKGNFDKEIVIDPMIFINKNKEEHLYNLLENNDLVINNLKRCNRCVLPETFPFIEFDDTGECNFCKNHKNQKQIQTFDNLKKLVEPYKNKNGTPDCIIPFSGGRDSTFTLHVAKKELGLNPIAFTYDWGMVTDLARRNIARVCGKLGVENIIVSADIKWKRENIKKNIIAWLKAPELGMIPLFMAGDKYFFYYCNEVKKQTGIDLNLWGINNLENTNFKTGFAGLPPQFDKKTIYSLSRLNQLKLFGFVGKNLIKSPGYLNQSLIDSLGSFAVRYLSSKKDYFHLFDYYKWSETEIESVIKEYNWEKAIDTDSTWRIGDGTVSFYNYIYYTVAGFTENDTFRSNQIREGMITRQEALQKVQAENQVRYETLRWYIEILNLDFKEVIETINKIPKLYSEKN